MLTFISFMSLNLSMIFIFLTHPMSIGLILLLQTLVTALILGFFSQNFWFSYILFMIMIGGMLVLFIYMTSVASNEKFLISYSAFFMILIMTFLYFMFQFIDPFFLNLATYFNDKIQISNSIQFEQSFNKYYFSPSNMILILLMIYLFITLIAVVKITNINYGPLRQKF